MAATPWEARPPRAPRIVLSRGGAVAARWAHNPKVGGSNPSPATKSAAVPVRDRRFVVPDPASRWSRASSFLRDLLYPPTCSGCGERGVWLCERCRPSLPVLTSVPACCGRCGIPIVRSRCGCSALHPRVIRAVSGFAYAGWVVHAVRGVKYAGERDRAVFLGSLIASTPAADLVAQADLIVPVPMHHDRERERGYNQAAVMAEALCRTLGSRPPSRLLVQHEERPSQVGLTAHQRRLNMRGAFAVDDRVAAGRGLHIVLVDDVRTTGSTLNACVEALRPLRPSKIEVVTLAAELPDEVIVEMLARVARAQG